MFLKGMDDRFLLSKDQRLTPNIDNVMSVNVSILKKASKLSILHELSKVSPHIWYIVTLVVGGFDLWFFVRPIPRRHGKV